jgi:hypothetical protein
MASSRFRARMRKNPPNCSFVSANGPSVVNTWPLPDAHGRGRLNGREVLREDPVTALREHRVIGAGLAHEGIKLALGRSFRRGRRSRAGLFDYRAREGTHGERRQAMINGLRGASI